MKLYCLADEETVRGFRLAGLAGRAAATPEQAASAFHALAALPDCGLLIVTQPVADGIRELVDRYRLEQERPLIVEIPGPTGWVPGHKHLRQIAQDAVGVRVD